MELILNRGLGDQFERRGICKYGVTSRLRNSSTIEH